MRLISIHQVKRATTLNETAIESLSAEGLFPYAVALPHGGRAWLAKEVSQWVEAVAKETPPELLELLCQTLLDRRPVADTPEWRCAA